MKNDDKTIGSICVHSVSPGTDVDGPGMAREKNSGRATKSQAGKNGKEERAEREEG
jgi:hypothetical protein